MVERSKNWVIKRDRHNDYLINQYKEKWGEKRFNRAIYYIKRKIRNKWLYSANKIQKKLQSEGLGIRRADLLDLVRLIREGTLEVLRRKGQGLYPTSYGVYTFNEWKNKRQKRFKNYWLYQFKLTVHWFIKDKDGNVLVDDDIDGYSQLYNDVENFSAIYHAIEENASLTNYIQGEYLGYDKNFQFFKPILYFDYKGKISFYQSTIEALRHSFSKTGAIGSDLIISWRVLDAKVILWKQVKKTTKEYKQFIKKRENAKRKRNKNVKEKHHPWMAFDVETDRNGDFICGAVWGDYYVRNKKGVKEIHVEKTFDNLDEFQNWFRDITSKEDVDIQFTAFNTNYDIVYLWDLIDNEYGFKKIIWNKGRFIVAYINDKKIIDITNHVHGSLEDNIKMLQSEGILDVKKIQIDFDNVDIEKLKKRCLEDAKATCILTQFIEDFYVYQLGVKMRLTTSSTARKLWEIKYSPIKLKEVSLKQKEFEREAYRGGRVEVFEHKKRELVSVWDVNSMYLWCQEQDYPVPHSGVWQHWGIKDVYEAIKKEKFALIECQVIVPPQKVAPLPLFYNDKLIFPVGRFWGVWTSIELKEALKYGVEIIQVGRVLEYKRKMRLFAKFVKNVHKKRNEFKKSGNKLMEKLVKLIGNGNYGKFGEMRETYLICVGVLPNEVIEQLKDNGCRIDFINDDIFVVSTGRVETDNSYPILAAWTTSLARVKLLQGLKANEDRVIYCDTDSIHLKGFELPKGVEVDDYKLGAYKYEGRGYGIYYASKNYFISKFKEGDNRKLKGVPKKAIEIKRQKDKIVYQYEKPNKIKESIRRKLKANKWEVVVKEVSLTDSKKPLDNPVIVN